MKTIEFTEHPTKLLTELLNQRLYHRLEGTATKMTLYVKDKDYDKVLRLTKHTPQKEKEKCKTSRREGEGDGKSGEPTPASLS